VHGLAFQARERLNLFTGGAHWICLEAHPRVAWSLLCSTEPAWLARIGVFTVSIPTAIRTNWHITGSTRPAVGALTKVWPDCNSVQAGRETHGLRTVGVLPTIEALAVLRRDTPAVDAISTDGKIALLPKPTFLTDAFVWTNACAVQASPQSMGEPVVKAHGLVAVKANPAFVALTALAIRSVVILKALLKVFTAACCFVLLRVCHGVKEFVLLLLAGARGRVKTVLQGIFATWTLRALLLEHAATFEVHSSVVRVMHCCVVWVLAAVLVDGARVAHRPVQGLASVKSLKDCFVVVVHEALLLGSADCVGQVAPVASCVCV
jgi:hypothetical protein